MRGNQKVTIYKSANDYPISSSASIFRGLILLKRKYPGILFAEVFAVSICDTMN